VRKTGSAAPLPPLEGADGMHGKARNRREFLLREARSLPEGSELRPKGSRSADSHTGESYRFPVIRTNGVRGMCERCGWSPLPSDFRLAT
jgi:hypothetical protein